MNCPLVDPGLSLRSNPGLKLTNAFGVKPWAEIQLRRSHSNSN
jgi:hypothetical protein